MILLPTWLLFLGYCFRNARSLASACPVTCMLLLRVKILWDFVCLTYDNLIKVLICMFCLFLVVSCGCKLVFLTFSEICNDWFWRVRVVVDVVNEHAKKDSIVYVSCLPFET